MIFFALAGSCSVARAERDISLFDHAGEPRAYIADDLTIYLWTGEPLAYLVPSPQKADIYSFEGKHLGWFERGVLRDHAGYGVGAVKNALIGVTSLEPLKGLKGLKPLKGIREVAPIKPIFGTEWSSIPLVVFLKTGMVPQDGAPRSPTGPPRTQPGEANCESGHWIESVSSGGKVLKLEDGSIWAVNAVDVVTSSIWLPVSDVLICGTKIINVDEGETVEATRLSPSRSVPAQSSTVPSYAIQASSNDETFVINGEIFKAKTYCFGMEKGDKVTFISGSPSGACVSAEILNMRTGKTCRVWCE